MIGTIAFFSDTHLAAVPGEGDTSPDVMLGRAVEAVRAAGMPDLVVLPGDIADDGSPSAYERVTALLAPLGAPVLATPGNHDLRENVAAAFGGASTADLDGWRVVLVDTVVPGEIHGAVDIPAVEAALGPDVGVPTVVVLHHPPITRSTLRWFVLDGDVELVRLLTGRTDVRLVVSGHLHDAFHAVVGGVTFLGCSSTWYSIEHQQDRWTPSGGPVGALLMTLGPGDEYRWELVPT